MATKKTAAVAAGAAETKEAAGNAEKKFPLERLKKNSHKLFHVSSIVFAGATSDLPDGNYSVAEIDEIIKAWLKKEVK